LASLPRSSKRPTCSAVNNYRDDWRKKKAGLARLAGARSTEGELDFSRGVTEVVIRMIRLRRLVSAVTGKRKKRTKSAGRW